MADVSRGPNLAASIEASLERRAATVLARRGWRPTPVVYDTYGRAAVDGEGGWIRLLCRVLVMPPTARRSAEGRSRGFRRYLSVSAPDLPVRVRIGDTVHRVRTEPGGYLDVRLPVNLPAGQHEVHVEVPGGADPGRGRVDVVDPAIGRGVVSDIDDTAMITLLPSPLQAFWNTFVMQEGQRRPVPGMATFLGRENQGFIVYVSTGAWNYAPVIRHFLDRYEFPAGALILTDWGPSAQRWFRSGLEHKRTQLRRLREEFPELRWVLVGDDGQRDPGIYAEFAAEFPQAVDTVAIRTLTPAEHLLTAGTPLAPDELARRVPVVGLEGRDPAEIPDGVRQLRGGDGNALVVASL
ncbi:App1 family protein [Litorihabitans aurantiacus]|uniref:Phosphatidate phosphatase APP1 catalytic domain-containing protein n=1 Tax=Litorihabitans aurantiacus TaxID=1930061 RepID=A0AA37UGY8_9MICO|nr:phosphatase domain-containing protein [Litorihabitans aurantiacus]GMA30234.1 hypothetical protein GCM10025875_02260 [Litorihabitans aurantiacus]